MQTTQRKTTKTLIIILVVLIAIGIAYFALRPGSGGGLLGDALVPAQTDTELDPDSYSNQVGRELVQLLGELESVTLDRDFIESEVFMSLNDLSYEPEDQPDGGRENPFSPIQ